MILVTAFFVILKTIMVSRNGMYTYKTKNKTQAQ